MGCAVALAFIGINLMFWHFAFCEKASRLSIKDILIESHKTGLYACQ
jgi:hypothetical protein